MPVFRLKSFKGINTKLPDRGHTQYLLGDTINLQSKDDVLKLRSGYVDKADVATDSIEDFFIYQDEEWGKDVLLTYEEAALTSNRRI